MKKIKELKDGMKEMLRLQRIIYKNILEIRSSTTLHAKLFDPEKIKDEKPIPMMGHMMGQVEIIQAVERVLEDMKIFDRLMQLEKARGYAEENLFKHHKSIKYLDKDIMDCINKIGDQKNKLGDHIIRMNNLEKKIRVLNKHKSQKG